MVRRVSSDFATISTVAGSARIGFGGDRGPAVRAMLNNPRGVAVDASRTLYIADSENHRIRAVDLASGVITTIAGTGAARFGGDTGAASRATFFNPRGLTLDNSGGLIVADVMNNRLRRIAP